MKVAIIVLFYVSELLGQSQGSKASSAGSDPVLPGGRKALVIGIGDYKGKSFSAPVEHSRLMSTVLRDKDFDVIHVENVNVKQLKTAIKLFSWRLNASTAVVYFAGHSVVFDGRLYLVPADAQLRQESDIPYECVDISDLVDRIDRNPMNLVLLETGTDHRLNALWPAFAEPRSVLWPAMENTVLVAASDPAQRAGRAEFVQGLFTRELVEQIHQPGERAHAALKRTLNEVEIASSGLQRPVLTGSAVAFFRFTPEPAYPDLAGRENTRKRVQPD
jgi:hypothetical protein